MLDRGAVALVRRRREVVEAGGVAVGLVVTRDRRVGSRRWRAVAAVCSATALSATAPAARRAPRADGEAPSRLFAGARRQGARLVRLAQRLVAGARSPPRPAVVSAPMPSRVGVRSSRRRTSVAASSRSGPRASSPASASAAASASRPLGPRAPRPPSRGHLGGFELARPLADGLVVGGERRRLPASVSSARQLLDQAGARVEGGGALARRRQVCQAAGDGLRLAQRRLRSRLLVAARARLGRGGVALDDGRRAPLHEVVVVCGPHVLEDRRALDLEPVVLPGEGRRAGLQGLSMRRVERGVEQRREDLLLVLRLGLEELLEATLRQHDDLAELLGRESRGGPRPPWSTSVQPSARGLPGTGSPSRGGASGQAVAACSWVVVPSPRLRGRSCCGGRTTR